MTIDWLHFTPWTALGGGLLIGLAAVLLLFANGRIAGISGILAGAVRPPATGERGWRLAFVLGIVLAPLLHGVFAQLPAIEIEAGKLQLVLAGLLVGFGASYGSGCTSGHGVCGLSRFSVRSLVATLSFMAAGFVTVFLWRHLF